MASSNSTPYYLNGGHSFAGLPDTFTGVPQQSNPYSNITSPEHTSALHVNQEGEQCGIGDVWMNTTSDAVEPGNDYPQDFDIQHRGWFPSEEAFNRRNDKKPSLGLTNVSDLVGMPYSEEISYPTTREAETDPNQAAQTVRGVTMQGMNFIQHSTINNFANATQFQPHQSMPPFSNFGGHDPTYNLNIGDNNQISNKVSRYGPVLPPPSYPAPASAAPRFDDSGTPGYGAPNQVYGLPGQGYRLPDHDYELPNQDNYSATVPAPGDASGRSSQPSRKGRRKAADASKANKVTKAVEAAKARAARAAKAAVAKVTKPAKVKTRKTSQAKVKTGRQPQLKALPARLPSTSNGTSQTYYGVYRVPTISGFVTRTGQVPRPAERSNGRSAVATRANDPTQRYGNQIKDYPFAKVAPPRNIDIGMLEICTFFPNWLLLPEAAMRAQVNDWKRKDIVRAELYATDSLKDMGEDDMKQADDRIQKQFSNGGRSMFDFEGDWSGSIPEKCGYTGNQDLTANNWHFKSQWADTSKEAQFEHIDLKLVYTRVRKWPEGADRLNLTKCLEFAFANKHLDLDTSHFDWMSQVLGLVPGASLNAAHDKAAAERFRTRVPRS